MDADQHIIRSREIVNEFVKMVKAGSSLTEHDGQIRYFTMEVIEFEGNPVSVRKINLPKIACVHIQPLRQAPVNLFQEIKVYSGEFVESGKYLSDRAHKVFVSQKLQLLAGTAVMQAGASLHKGN
ncbi:MAG: hypothetical protein A4E57_02717 [Syntrophorhabdaceae bacterium PtaU1.Bin034]|nr:MAG: hypothetical protein A4E57_02717 [Syntrophorhabdaceae bacterium PtaU1.Bin034]